MAWDEIDVYQWHRHLREQRQPTKALGIWALVLGWLPCFCVSQVVAVVLAVVVLVRSKPGQDHGKKPALLGLAGVGFWILLTVALAIWDPFGPDRDAEGQVTSAGVVRVDDLRTGDCGSARLLPPPRTIRVVPCRQSHTFQVVSTFELKGGAYPGARRVDGRAQDGCVRRLRGMLTMRQRRGLDVIMLMPLAESWPVDRRVMCVLQSKKPLHGSLLESSSAHGVAA